MLIDRQRTTIQQAIIPIASLSSDKDSVCHMKLVRPVADTAHYEGKRWGFCSKSYADRFHQQPARCVKP